MIPGLLTIIDLVIKRIDIYDFLIWAVPMGMFLFVRNCEKKIERKASEET